MNKKDRDPTKGHNVGQIDPDDDDNTPTVRTPRGAAGLEALDHDQRTGDKK